MSIYTKETMKKFSLIELQSIYSVDPFNIMRVVANSGDIYVEARQNLLILFLGDRRSMELFSLLHDKLFAVDHLQCDNGLIIIEFSSLTKTQQKELGLTIPLVKEAELIKFLPSLSAKQFNEQGLAIRQSLESLKNVTNSKLSGCERAYFHHWSGKHYAITRVQTLSDPMFRVYEVTERKQTLVLEVPEFLQGFSKTA
jgi:hypothetical protein